MAFSLKKISDHFENVTWTKINTYCRSNDFLDYLIYKENQSVKTMAVIKKQNLGSLCEHFGVQENKCENFFVEGLLYSDISSYQNKIEKSKEDCQKVRDANTEMSLKIIALKNELEKEANDNKIEFDKLKKGIDELINENKTLEEENSRLKSEIEELQSVSAIKIADAEKKIHKQYLNKKNYEEEKKHRFFLNTLNTVTAVLIFATIISCFVVFGAKTVETISISIVLSLVIILMAIVNSYIQERGTPIQKRVSLFLLIGLSFIEFYFHGNSFQILLEDKIESVSFLSWVMAIIFSTLTACSIWFRRTK